MEERRKTERIQTRLPVQWQAHSGVLEGTLINCSLAGCFVQGEVEEPGNEPVRLTIRLPGELLIKLWGTVTFYLPTMGFGLHFISVSDEDQSMFDLWRKYLEGEQASVNLTSKPTAVSALNSTRAT
jgi:hypothetical protein